jgi:hypothetical protein
MVKYGKPVESFAGQADTFSRMVGSVSRMADDSSRPAGSLNRTADTFARMAGSVNRMAGGHGLMAAPVNRMAGAFSRVVGGSNLAAEPANLTNKSFIGADKSSRRPVFRQNHAKIGKNRLFSLSRRAQCPKATPFAGRSRPSETTPRLFPLPSDGSGSG